LAGKMQKAREFLGRAVNFSCGLGVFRVVSPLKISPSRERVSACKAAGAPFWATVLKSCLVQLTHSAQDPTKVHPLEQGS
jgi:hypothetical protein